MDSIISLIGSIFKVIIYASSIISISVLIYYFVIALFGFYRKEDKKYSEDKDKTFALVVAAHNEEVVIEQIVESLKHLDYKKELYDIFVIADNCTDSTAEIARNAGALVCERFDTKKRGKGYALEWMFDKIFKMEKKYDAVVVFDADNLASENFLRAMSNKLNEGYKVVQGYLDSKNPHDSWITEAYSIAFWSNNRMFQLARNNLGLSNQIGGTGFCIDTETLRELGWGATCLTEDLEFTCKLVMNGHRVGWAHDAVIYDEKPLTLKQSWNQRKRWMQGFADVASRYFTKLLKKAFREKSWRVFDCALYTIQPYITIIAGIAVIFTSIYGLTKIETAFTYMQKFFNDHTGLMLLFQIVAIVQFLITPVVILIEKKISKWLVIYFAVYSSNIIISASLYKYLRDVIFDKKWLGAHGIDAQTIKTILGNGLKGDPNEHGLVPIIVPILVGTWGLLFLIGIILLIYAIHKKNLVKQFIWYILYSIYVLTWFPITIQAVLNKNNKEWSHTKHTRGISMKELNKKSVA